MREIANGGRQLSDGHRRIARCLVSGLVLVAGGQDSQHKELYSAEVYALLTNTFTLLTALMTTSLSGHIGLTLLHNGKVLIAGGTSAGKPVATAEVYDPVLGQFWEVRIAQHRPAAVKALCRFLVRPDAGSATRWLESRLARRVRTHAR
jgi:Kelch motif